MSVQRHRRAIREATVSSSVASPKRAPYDPRASPQSADPWRPALAQLDLSWSRSLARRPTISTLLVALGFIGPLAAGVHAAFIVPETPVSMGQPDRLRINWGLASGYEIEDDEWTSRLSLSLTPEGIAPHLGIDFLNVEAALGHSGGKFDAALGAYLQLLFTRSGVEFNFTDVRLDPSFSVQFPLRRGGLFHRGDELRVDYRPRPQEIMLGFVFNRPFRRYRATRPLRKHVSLPEASAPEALRTTLPQPIADELKQSLAVLVDAIPALDRWLTPRLAFGNDFDASAIAYKREIDEGRGFVEQEERYHAQLERALALAVGDPSTGNLLARRAEDIIFHEVLVPFNSTFGRPRKPNVPSGFLQEALREFALELEQRSLDNHARRTAIAVFDRVLRAIGDVARVSEKRWEQSRLVWLPLNYGLRREQYDTQREWDVVIEALTQQHFTDSNTIEYILNDQFHKELTTLIQETRTYQVTIVHDVRGRFGDNETDRTGWDLVVDGYLRSFEDAITAIDAGTREHLPEFTLFLDQHFYQANRSREIISVLEDLYSTPDIDLKDTQVEARVLAAHTRLRKQIARSPVFRDLQPAKLRQLFKVHVNVTNPTDSGFPFDVLLRDHRKLAFRDVVEEDPGSGVGIFTGHGVGDHYRGPAWEDRGMVMRGPTLLHLKQLAEQLFRSQGFEAEQVPAHLRTRPLPTDYAQKCAELRRKGWTTRALITTNETGYGDKECTVLKATVLNLAVPGSVLFSFDSLWISDYWAGMAISAALRGARVYPVAPAPENAPSSALPTMVLMRENLAMMLKARLLFADDIERAGGRLRVGLYAHEISVADDRHRAAAFLHGREATPFFKDEFPVHESVVEVLEQAAQRDDLPGTPGRDRDDVADSERHDDDNAEVRPYLHLKTQLFASRQAIQILAGEFWTAAVRAYMQVRAQQVSGLPSAGITPDLLNAHMEATASRPSTGVSVREHLENLSPEVRESAIWSLAIGSFNQDRRSMLLNGEVLLNVTGEDVLITLPDFMFILGTAWWPENATELGQRFPNQNIPGVLRRFFRYLQDLI